MFLWGRPYASNICFMFPLYMESNALEEFTNNSVASRFFACITLMIQQIVRICKIVDQFLRKPFWFFLRIFSILGLI